MEREYLVFFCNCGKKYKAEFKACMLDGRGWVGQGYRFRTVNSEAGANVVVHFKTTAQLEELYKQVPYFQTELKGLSITDSTDKNKIKVFMNVNNWLAPPKAFVVYDGSTIVGGGDRVRIYRQYLCMHELGHVLQFDHYTAGYEDAGAPCHPMMQQTKGTAPKCRANPWITMI